MPLNAALLAVEEENGKGEDRGAPRKAAVPSADRIVGCRCSRASRLDASPLAASARLLSRRTIAAAAEAEAEAAKAEAAEAEALLRCARRKAVD